MDTLTSPCSDFACGRLKDSWVVYKKCTARGGQRNAQRRHRKVQGVGHRNAHVRHRNAERGDTETHKFWDTHMDTHTHTQTGAHIEVVPS